MEDKKEPYSLPLKSWKALKDVNDAYARRIGAAIGSGKPIIIATAMIPQQIPNAFDAVYIAGEWYGSICGFFNDVALCETAEKSGFPHELCSYARMTLGSMIQDRGFLGKYPKPAAVLGAEGLCSVQEKWFEALARYHNAPFFAFDSAPIMSQDVKYWGEEAVKDSVEFVARQCGNMIEFLEWATGQKMQEEKLIETTITMHKNEDLWDEMIDLWGRKPSPVTIRNLFTFENLIISLPCHKDSTKVMQAAIDEFSERIEKGITGLSNEKLRLLWHAQPGWYILNVFKYFESKGATFVGSPYLELWGTKYRYEWTKNVTPQWFKEWKDPTNVDECLWQIAKGIVAMEVRPRLDPSIEMLKEMAVRTQADGAVWHAVRGCKGVSYGGLGEREALRDELGIPGFVMEGSPADPRDFSEGPALRQARIFIEQVTRIKNRRTAKLARR
jgi:benzoyl-CoA reductase/2-hydroxyglutaryl-CoA dehydratase subunit BcrC/BadD/HgdB